MFTYYLYLPTEDEKSYHPLRHLLYLTVWKPYLESSPRWIQSDKDNCDLSNRDPILNPRKEFPYLPGGGRIFHHIRIFPVTWLTDKVPCARFLKKNQSPFNLQTRWEYYPPTFVYDPQNPSLTLRQYQSSQSKSKSGPTPSPLWYYKPSQGGGTRGVILSHDFMTLYSYAQKQLKPSVIQQEISQPDLSLDRRKYEIRWYVVFTYQPSYKELYLWWWNEGYLVLSPKKYSSKNLDTSGHFTNRSTSSDRERASQEYQMTLSEAIPRLGVDLNREGHKLIQSLAKRLSQLRLTQNLEPRHYPEYPQYEVLAVDCIWSNKDQKLSLVEINRYPGLYLSRDTDSCRNLKTRFYQTVLQDLVEPLLDGQSLHPNSSGTPDTNKISKIPKNLIGFNLIH